jgi:phosphohistidine phosphatase
MNLYLLRHAIAVERGTTRVAADFDRPLTEEGRAKLLKVVRAMAAMELGFSAVFTSPYVRARQTADVVVTELKTRARVRECEFLRAEAQPADLVRFLARLRPQPRDVLLVGHEPFLSELASLLLAGATPLRLDFKKAGLCKLSATRLQPAACATLEWFLSPKLLALMAR